MKARVFWHNKRYKTVMAEIMSPVFMIFVFGLLTLNIPEMVFADSCQVIANCDFDDMPNDTAWQKSPGINYTNHYGQGTGSWWGNNLNGGWWNDASVSQFITLPSNATVLDIEVCTSCWYTLDGTDTQEQFNARISVKMNGNFLLNADHANPSPGISVLQFDISSYASQQVNLELIVEGDGNEWASMFVNSVHVRLSTTGGSACEVLNNCEFDNMRFDTSWQKLTALNYVNKNGQNTNSWWGNTDNGGYWNDAAVSQVVSLPASASVLVVEVCSSCTNTTNGTDPQEQFNARMSVKINGSYLADHIDPPAGLVPLYFDISDYADQTITLELWIEGDGNEWASMFMNSARIHAPTPGNFNEITKPKDGSATGERIITVEGRTLPHSDITLSVGSNQYTTVANDGGIYSLNGVGLQSGVNVIESRSASPAGIIAVDSISVVYGNYLDNGTFNSSVKDAGSVVAWQTISWVATIPPGTTLHLKTRSGNTSSPNSSWSDWSSPYSMSGATIVSPASRYIQYQATFQTTNPNLSPILDEVVITFPTSGGGGTPGPAPTPPGWESQPLEGMSPSNFLDDGSSSITASTSEIDANNEQVAAAPQRLVLPPLAELINLIPLQGPDNTYATIESLPETVQLNLDTVEAYNANYVDTTTGETRAVIFTTKTIEHPYNHDYAVCGRFHDFTLETVGPNTFPQALPGGTNPYEPPIFWQCELSQGGTVERAVVATVFVNEAEGSFLVDSRWIQHDYLLNPPNFDYDYILNFQFWSYTDHLEAYELLQRLLQNLSLYGTVIFTNTVPPNPPTVYMKSADYFGGNIDITTQNILTMPITTTFEVSARRVEGSGIISFTLTFEELVPPGESLVELAVGDLIDAVVISTAQGYRDKVYIGDGFFFAFSDEDSAITFDKDTCTTIAPLSTTNLSLPGCGHVTGTVAPPDGYVGMVRTLSPSGKPADISEYDVLIFWARGDNKSYSVAIESASVTDNDYHEFVVTVGPDWRQYIIPLAAFQQRGWGTPVPYTGTDVKSVLWRTIVQPIDGTINLEIAGVSFGLTPLIESVAVLSDTTNTSLPYSVTATIVGDVELARLHYSVDHMPFISVPMIPNGVEWAAQIPLQPLGSEIRYYIEVTDMDGNLATNPVDISCTVYRFQIDIYPQIIIDDFCDTNPANVLGEYSWVFTDGQGSEAVLYYDNGRLRVDYDVTGSGEYAGYLTELESIDLTAYGSIVLSVQGSYDGLMAKIGLKDTQGNEPKIELSEYLMEGVTTESQELRIPLVALTSVTDLAQIAGLTIVFENSMGSETGSLYADDLRIDLVTAPVFVHNFNDQTDPNGLGGSTWTTVGGGATITAAYDPVHRTGDSGFGLHLDYAGVSSTAWAVWGTDLMGVDLSPYDTLSFFVQGDNGGEQPNIYLEDGNLVRKFVNLEDYTTVTTQGQFVAIPLADFASQGIDISDVRYLQIVFEWEPMAGDLYLDNIAFTCAQSPGGCLPVCNGPEIPLLTTPANGSADNDNTPHFVWEATNGATEYQIQIDDSSDFSSPIISTVTVTTNLTVSSALPDGLYYWRVRGRNIQIGCNVVGDWSNVWNFTVDTTPTAAPILLTPGNGTFTNDNTPTFDWNVPIGAVAYQLQVDSSPDFSNPLADVMTATSHHTIGSALNDGSYYWRVRTSDMVGNLSQWSTIWVVLVDTDAPTIIVPGTITEEATSPAGATINYTVTVTDTMDPNPTVSCAPPSGNVFPLGNTIVVCNAFDAAGNQSTNQFEVHVVDTTPPVITVPITITAEATSPSGTEISYLVDVYDIVDPFPVLVCLPASGSTFPLGPTEVTCTATDYSNNQAVSTFNVLVIDTTAPILVVPADMTVQATSPDGAVVTYTVTVTDTVDMNPTIMCDPASGTLFPIGIITVSCTAIDFSGNATYDSFEVTVAEPVHNIFLPLLFSNTQATSAATSEENGWMKTVISPIIQLFAILPAYNNTRHRKISRPRSLLKNTNILS